VSGRLSSELIRPLLTQYGRSNSRKPSQIPAHPYAISLRCIAFCHILVSWCVLVFSAFIFSFRFWPFGSAMLLFYTLVIVIFTLFLSFLTCLLNPGPFTNGVCSRNVRVRKENRRCAGHISPRRGSSGSSRSTRPGRRLPTGGAVRIALGDATVRSMKESD